MGVSHGVVGGNDPRLNAARSHTRLSREVLTKLLCRPNGSASYTAEVIIITTVPLVVSRETREALSAAPTTLGADSRSASATGDTGVLGNGGALAPGGLGPVRAMAVKRVHES